MFQYVSMLKNRRGIHGFGWVPAQARAAEEQRFQLSEAGDLSQGHIYYIFLYYI